MVALVLVNIGFPTAFLVVRLIMHATDPNPTAPPAATRSSPSSSPGSCTSSASSWRPSSVLGGLIDLTEGVFRHLVVTGRSRLALYFARIPAGLGIVVPIVAAGFAIVCVVCTLAAPTTNNFDGANVPTGLTLVGFEQWAVAHPDEAICDLPDYNVNVYLPCFGPPPGTGGIGAKGGPGTPPTTSSPAQIHAAAIVVAKQNYAAYTVNYLNPRSSP